MDWKDALSSLRGSLDDPEPDDLREESEEEKPVAKSQASSVTVLIDRKGRNGKTATIIEGFTIPDEQIEDIARQLKQKLGVGGSVRAGEILIQGDHREKVIDFLNKMNFKTKKG